MWVPAGLVDGGLEGTITHQICLADQASWSQVPLSVHMESTLPDMDAFIHTMLSIDG